MGLFSDSIHEFSAPKLKQKFLGRSLSMSNKPIPSSISIKNPNATDSNDKEQQQQQLQSKLNSQKNTGELSGPGKSLTSVAAALVTNCSSSSSSSSVSNQQLSTSWEYIRPTLEYQQTSTDTKEEQGDVQLPPARYIEIQKGKISLGPPPPIPSPLFPPPAAVLPTINNYESIRDREVLEARIAELEGTLSNLHEKINQQTQCGSSLVLEKDLRAQLDSMNRSIKLKERKAMQTYRDHKLLQARFQRQENCLQYLTNENKNLHQRIRQYEHCLDDVMRKVVDAIVAEDNLREEVHVLKNRVRDLELQNAVLSSSSSASPAKGRGDEGYCTMSSGQPQPCGSHLEDLPEEPDHQQQLLMSLPTGGGSSESCTADMEDWSMSNEEFGGAVLLDDDTNEHEWFWNASHFLNSNVDSQSESISQLLRDTIIYSDDEEIVCKDFKRDFYKLVNIKSVSNRSLRSSTLHDDGDDEADISDTDVENVGNADDNDGDDVDDDDYDDDDDEGDDELENENRKTEYLTNSPTPSEAGRDQVCSCSSSDDSVVIDKLQQQQQLIELRHPLNETGSNLLQTVLNSNVYQNKQSQSFSKLYNGSIKSPQWRRSSWKMVSSQLIESTSTTCTTITPMTTLAQSNLPTSPLSSSSIPTFPPSAITIQSPITSSPSPLITTINSPIVHKKEVKMSRLPTLQSYLPSVSLPQHHDHQNSNNHQYIGISQHRHQPPIGALPLKPPPVPVRRSYAS